MPGGQGYGATCLVCAARLLRAACLLEDARWDLSCLLSSGVVFGDVFPCFAISVCVGFVSGVSVGVFSGDVSGVVPMGCV